MRRTAVVMISLAVLGGAAACGGDSDGAGTTSPPPDEARASEFTEASALIARYCLKDPDEGIERAEADAALDRLIGIAREHPDEEYVPAISYRESLTHPGVNLTACDAALAAKHDKAVAELD